MPGVPAPVTDERDGLRAFVTQQHHVLRIAAHGLTDEQARKAASVSSLSVGTLLKHVTAMEETWMVRVDAAPELAAADQRPMAERAAAHADDFTVRDDETLAAILERYDDRCRRTEEAIPTLDLDVAVPVPEAPWFPAGSPPWSVRWVLLHLIEEVARHAGHADIVRESIDGATGFELMAAAEGWPETDWLKPWKAGG
ncbi:MAG: DinB family protein [Actinomycetes bacterium]